MANDEFCPGCSARYSEPHKEGCAVFARLTEEMEVIRQAHLKSEEEKGELIAPGEDGVYIKSDETGAPFVWAYVDGGHNCTMFEAVAVLKWLVRNRYDIVEHVLTTELGK